MAIIQSNGTGGGDWHVGATWNGGSVPADTDWALILSGDTVEIDGDTTIGDTPATPTSDYVIDVLGTLKWKDNPSGSWTLNCRGSIRIQPDGEFSIGTDANPIPENRTATLLIADHNPNYIISLRQISSGDPAAPVLRTRGAVDYHMASAAMHRARLVSGVSSGSNVAIEVDRAVDWEIGDVVFLGRGGSQTTKILDGSGQLLTTYENERATISDKTDSTHYELASLTYNHVGGDIIAHGTRNIVIESGATYGWSIWFDIGNNANAKHGTLDLSWTTLRNLGGLNAIYGWGICIYGYNNTDKLIEAGDYKMESTVIDGSGGPSTNCILFHTCHNIRQIEKDFNNLVIYCGAGSSGINFGYYGYAYGYYALGNVTVIGSRPWGVVSRGVYLTADSLWITFGGTATDPATHNCVRLMDQGASNLECEELLAHGGYDVISVEDITGTYRAATELRILSGEIYNGRFRGLEHEGMRDAAVTVRNVKIAHTHADCGMVMHNTDSPVGARLYNCEFDDCNIGGSSDFGGVYLSTASWFNMRLHSQKCRFGVVLQNKRSNIIRSNDTGDPINNANFRIRLEDCQFKECINPPASGEWGKWGEWRCAITFGTYDNGYPITINRQAVLDIVRPVVYDDSDVDQWPLTYPGVTYMGIFGGGGELRNEGTVVIDGSYAIKMTPWNGFAENAGTYRVPYKIPVESGNSVSVKISLRKTISQTLEKKRPRAVISGAGIYDEAYMPDTNDAWEELTLTGTAAYDGMVYFWVEPGYNFLVNAELQDPWYQTVYADKLVVSVT